MRQHHIMTQCLAVCVLLSAAIPGFAQEFQETREDFRDIFKQQPVTSLRSKTLKTKGLTPKGGTAKGPGGIVPDEYDKLIENPVARSLILFDFDSAQVKEESSPILKNLAESLKYDFPDIRLVIVGHTDSVGSGEYNLDLSKRRAKAVKDVLVSIHAIKAERLTLRWYGETSPFIEENPQNSQNRRVEFIRIE